MIILKSVVCYVEDLKPRSRDPEDKTTNRQTFHLRSTPPHNIPSMVKKISLSTIVQFIVMNLFEEIVRRTKALQHNEYLYDTLVY